MLVAIVLVLPKISIYIPGNLFNLQAEAVTLYAKVVEMDTLVQGQIQGAGGWGEGYS